MQKVIADKQQFRSTLLQEWNKEALEKGRLMPEARKGMSEKASYLNN